MRFGFGALCVGPACRFRIWADPERQLKLCLPGREIEVRYEGSPVRELVSGRRRSLATVTPTALTAPDRTRIQPPAGNPRARTAGRPSWILISSAGRMSPSVLQPFLTW